MEVRKVGQDLPKGSTFPVQTDVYTHSCALTWIFKVCTWGKAQHHQTPAQKSHLFAFLQRKGSNTRYTPTDTHAWGPGWPTQAQIQRSLLELLVLEEWLVSSGSHFLLMNRIFILGFFPEITLFKNMKPSLGGTHLNSSLDMTQNRNYRNQSSNSMAPLGSYFWIYWEVVWD